MKRHLSFVLLFVIGCATGGVASQLVVPPARAGANPTRWEYYCSSAEPGKINDTLNKMGAEGWEMSSGFVSTFQGRFDKGLVAEAYGFCFKRALP